MRSSSSSLGARTTRRRARVGGAGQRRGDARARATRGRTTVEKEEKADANVEETTTTNTREGADVARRTSRSTRSNASSSSSRETTSSREGRGADEVFATIGRGACAACAAAACAAAAATFVDATTFDGTTGAPSGGCGMMSSERLRAARAVMMCNQENWRDGCLANYDDGSFDYVDGPGLTKIRGKKEMERYLKNQFDFSKQFLTVEEEVCEADSYVATWRLDMLLGTGPLRNVQGISVLKFTDDQDSSKIVYHRDYLPDGPIWENAPIVGPLVKLQRQTYTSCMQMDIGCAKILGGVADEK